MLLRWTPVCCVFFWVSCTSTTAGSEAWQASKGAVRCMVLDSSRLVSGKASCAIVLQHLSRKMARKQLLLLRSWCAACAAKVEVAEYLPVCNS